MASVIAGGCKFPFQVWRRLLAGELRALAAEQWTAQTGPSCQPWLPWGGLFDFRAGTGPEAMSGDSAKSSLPSMPEWLYRRPHLTGEDLLKVFPQPAMPFLMGLA